MTSEVFDVVTPRQLASSVGKTGVGSTDSAASSATIGDSPDLQQPIYFGSLGFHPHSPVVQSTFEDLQAGVETSFGKLRFYVNKWGTLRLTDTPRFAAVKGSYGHLEGGVNRCYTKF